MEAPPLDRTQVHVWTASLLTESEAMSGACAELAPDERARAERFRTPRLRRRFVVARVFLRRLLAAYAPVDASALRIGYGTNEKPYLVDTSGLVLQRLARGRRGNLCHRVGAGGRNRHRGDRARRRHRRRGCDKPSRPLNARRSTALAPAARREAFFRIWTRKEAYIKARGEGLGYPTRSFSVSHRARRRRPHRRRAGWGSAAPAGA